MLLTGCPPPPPKSQHADSAGEFKRVLATVIPAGTSQDDAEFTLKYREGLQPTEVLSGDFTANRGEQDERVYIDCHYLHCQQSFLLDSGMLRVIDIAVLLEGGVVKDILTSEQLIEREPGGAGNEPENNDASSNQ